MKNLSVVGHINFEIGHIFELRVRNVHSGKWYPLVTGTMNEVEDYCKHYYPEFDILMNTVYCSLEELRP